MRNFSHYLAHELCDDDRNNEAKNYEMLEIVFACETSHFESIAKLFFEFLTGHCSSFRTIRGLFFRKRTIPTCLYVCIGACILFCSVQFHQIGR